MAPFLNLLSFMYMCMCVQVVPDGLSVVVDGLLCSARVSEIVSIVIVDLGIVRECG